LRVGRGAADLRIIVFVSRSDGVVAVQLCSIFKEVTLCFHRLNCSSEALAHERSVAQPCITAQSDSTLRRVAWRPGTHREDSVFIACHMQRAMDGLKRAQNNPSVITSRGMPASAQQMQHSTQAPDGVHSEPDTRQHALHRTRPLAAVVLVAPRCKFSRSFCDICGAPRWNLQSDCSTWHLPASVLAPSHRTPSATSPSLFPRPQWPS
jgi:hypothetical protein